MDDISLSKASVRAEGDPCFRCTLGADMEAPVGFKAIRLAFDLEPMRRRTRPHGSSS
jgi:hypothetical protein